MTINGTTYEIIGTKEIMPGRTEIELRKPRGRRSYHVVSYEDGSLSAVV